MPNAKQLIENRVRGKRAPQHLAEDMPSPLYNELHRALVQLTAARSSINAVTAKLQASPAYRRALEAQKHIADGFTALNDALSLV